MDTLLNTGSKSESTIGIHIHMQMLTNCSPLLGPTREYPSRRCSPDRGSSESHLCDSTERQDAGEQVDGRHGAEFSCSRMGLFRESNGERWDHRLELSQLDWGASKRVR